MRDSLYAVAFAAVVFASSPAFAQDSDPVTMARGHYDRGAALYFEGDYGKAIVEFMRAYDMLPEPVFLYNIALSQWRLGNYDKAIEAAGQALRAPNLDPGLRTDIEGRLAAIHRLRHIANTDWSKPAPPVVEYQVAAVEQREPDEGGRGRRWVGLGLGAVGAGLLTGFVVTDLHLQEKASDYDAAAARGDAAEFARLRDEIEAGQPVALALLGSGAALLAVGGGLFIWDFVASERSSTALILGPTGVAISGEF